MDEIETIEGIGEVVRVSERPRGMGVVFVQPHRAQPGPARQAAHAARGRATAAGRRPAASADRGEPPSMTLTRRLLNLARANLNALLERADEPDDGPNIDSMSDEELEAELARRKARREREEQLRREREEAERAARERSAAGGGSRGSGGRTRSSGQPPRPSATGARRLAQYYAQLEVPFGADLGQVKAAYRRLMRKYHPDRFQDPQKAALATELTQKLSQAYREIEKALKGDRSRQT